MHKIENKKIPVDYMLIKNIFIVGGQIIDCLFRIIKFNEGLPKFLRVFREGLPDFFGELMRVLREGFS